MSTINASSPAATVTYLGDRERALQLRDVLNSALSLGVAEAIRLHGAVLNDTEKALVLSLTQEEIADLQSAAGQLSGLDRIAMDNNVNF
jgi:hypothetical protein